MILNRELKHLHIHVYKTGGESLMFYLQRLGWNQKNDKILNLGQHATLESFKKNNEYLEVVKDFYKTTMVRNPWEHAVSFYRHSLDRKLFLNENFFNYSDFNLMTDSEKLSKDKSFERFIKKGYIKRHQSLFLNEYDDLGLTFNEWFNYSEYDKMLKTFEDKFNIKINNNLRRHDKKKLDYVIDMDVNKPYQDFYNEETYNIVSALSKDLIDKFNYNF